MDPGAPDEHRPESFEAFVQATGTRMYRAAVLLCGDHHLAEDLTQATYAKVFASWRRVRRADSPIAYTRTVLTRTWLSHQRLRRSSEQPVAELPDSAQPGPDVTVRVDLVNALQELRADDRAVLVLRFYLDLSVAQTAHELNLGEAATRKRCERALERLRALLPEHADHLEVEL
jgi:RNA polymerase sigma-70 factor (sigma-E family)